MMKKILTGILAAAAVFALCACGKDAETTTTADNTTATTTTVTDTTTDAAPVSGSYYTDLVANTDILKGLTDYDITQVVKLGDYKSINVTLDGDYSVTDEDVKALVDESLNYYVPYIKNDETEVKADSYVNLNYKGIKDGEAFEGGTAEDQTIDVAGNCSTAGGGYIEGFTSGLPGAKVGETVSYEVTFPETYGKAELAGQTVIFEFTINYICDKPTEEKVRELEAAGENYLADIGLSGVDELYAVSREYEEYYAEQSRDQEIQTKALEALNAMCTVEIPESLLGAQLACICDIYTQNFCQEGESLADISEETFGSDYETFLSQLADQITSSLTNQLIFEAIAKAEGLEATDDEFNSYISELVISDGYADDVAFYNANGFADVEAGKVYFRGVCSQNNALNFLLDDVKSRLSK